MLGVTNICEMRTAGWLDGVSPGELHCGTALNALAFTDKVNHVKVKPVSVCEDEVLHFHRIFNFITASSYQPSVISVMLFACSLVCKYKFVLSLSLYV
jgi:hypothetical protein